MISAVYRVLNPFELLYCWKVGRRLCCSSCGTVLCCCTALCWPGRCCAPSSCAAWSCAHAHMRHAAPLLQLHPSAAFVRRYLAPCQVSLFDFLLYIVTFCVVIFAGVYW